MIAIIKSLRYENTMSQSRLSALNHVKKPIKYIILIFFIFVIFFFGYIVSSQKISKPPYHALDDAIKPITNPLRHSRNDHTVYILSISGGGIHGIIPAKILSYIESKTGKPISELFDLIIGTSTGAFQSIFLTIPNKNGAPKHSAKEMLVVYNQLAKRMLKTSWYHEVATLNGMLGPKFTNESRVKFFQQLGNNTRFGHLLTNVVIPTYDIIHSRPLLFVNWHISKHGPLYLDDNYRSNDILLAATSAPTLYPATRVGRKGNTHTLIDGGIFIADPAISGLILAMTVYPNRKYVLVSLNTGIRNLKLRSARFGGIGQWLMNYLPTQANAGQEFESILLENLSRNHPELLEFYSFDTMIPEEPIDNITPKNIQILNQSADQMIRNNHQQLDKLITVLLSS